MPKMSAKKHQAVSPQRPWTLNSLTELQRTGFGRPRPRHGQKLLYWFLAIIQDYNNNLLQLIVTYNTDFSFHPFENIENLLPNNHLKYWVLGNLSKPGARDLPEHILRYHTGCHDSSNMDRIIVRVDKNCLQTLYTVTELEQSVFSQFPPRHGLSMLYWFLHEIKSTDFNLYQLCENGTDRRQAQQSPVEANKAAFQDLLPAEADHTARPDVVTTQEPLPAETNVTAS
ncbi:hypothetical protein QTP70_007590 [Hemibagrus guttatus]|uniref:Uncharacterized protein n=1 Tax=Hemibagrus guttatus TaxID=175788 RepID=A0AAE0VB55_9TELE|nr:hypothetical protein QTP70_007590 [Hemibagrus guttatus]